MAPLLPLSSLQSSNLLIPVSSLQLPINIKAQGHSIKPMPLKFRRKPMPAVLAKAVSLHSREEVDTVNIAEDVTQVICLSFGERYISTVLFLPTHEEVRKLRKR